jgi:hypothetical protein
MLKMHEYLADYRLSPPYLSCVECNKRSQYVCTKCNYCYSCHYKIERKEKENEMKRRPLTLDKLHHLKSMKKLQDQPKYQVNFVTYKIAD